jgi:hypothetical protein
VVIDILAISDGPLLSMKKSFDRRLSQIKRIKLPEVRREIGAISKGVESIKQAGQCMKHELKKLKSREVSEVVLSVDPRTSRRDCSGKVQGG